jgi:hypothetical protein
MTTMKDNLSKVFDATVQKDDPAAAAAFSDYIAQKTIEMIKAHKSKINEDKSPIKLKGEDVFVNDKKVGRLKHHAEENKGLEYFPEGGGDKHKFAKLADLYTHLGKEHKLSESKDEKSEEKEIKDLPNREKFSKLKAFKSAGGEGLDADGDHDGDQDAKEADAKREKPEKKMIKKVDDKEKPCVEKGK